MPFAMRTSPPVARLNRLNRSSDHTAISAKPSWRLRICSHMAKVSCEYWLENWPEPQWRSAILNVPKHWGVLTRMGRGGGGGWGREGGGLGGGLRGIFSSRLAVR